MRRPRSPRGRQPPSPFRQLPAKCVQFSSGSDLAYATLVCLPPEFGVLLIRRVRSGGQGEMGIKLIKRLGQLRSGNGSAGGDAACTKAESARFNYNR